MWMIRSATLIGSLSGWNWTAKVDRSQSNFGKLLIQLIAQNEQSAEHSQKQHEKLKLGDNLFISR